MSLTGMLLFVKFDFVTKQPCGKLWGESGSHENLDLCILDC